MEWFVWKTYFAVEFISWFQGFGWLVSCVLPLCLLFVNYINPKNNHCVTLGVRDPECFAHYFLCFSRAMEDLENNTTVFSTLRSLNNFISQRMEGVSGLATPGSSQSSLQIQYQQRVQVRCPQLGDARSITSLCLKTPFDSRNQDWFN